MQRLYVGCIHDSGSVQGGVCVGHIELDVTTVLVETMTTVNGAGDAC